MNAIRLHTSIRDLPPRGGSAICETLHHIIIFGGADREQVSYQDIAALKKSDEGGGSAVFTLIDGVSGDVPMPRSGHAMVGYGKYVLLFGGIDFAEEAVYNDLYLLDTDTWEWHYVGEAGEEIPARNSHSLALLSDDSGQRHVLVVFGGASPEHGPLGDGYFATLPPLDAIDPASFHVHWNRLPSHGDHPCAREMHGCCSHRNVMFISGGRTESGDLRDDCWLLQFTPSSSEADGLDWLWRRLDRATLPEGRCAHSSIFLTSQNSEEYTWCIVGGMSASGIASDVWQATLRLDQADRQAVEWRKERVANTTIPARFGHCMCTLREETVRGLVGHPLYGSIIKREGLRLIPCEGAAGALLFGGVNAEQDLGDVWLLTLA